MRRALSLSFATILFLLLALPAQAQVDVTGTWEITQTTARGERTMTLTLAQEGSVVTGTMEMPAMGPPRGGDPGGPPPGADAPPREVEIENGQLEGERLTFTITMGRGDRTFTQTFTATVSGDTMEGTIAMSGGMREMEPMPFTGQKKES